MLEQYKRAQPRYNSEFNATWGKGSSGFVRNISMGGCFIETTENKIFNFSSILPDLLKEVNIQCGVKWKKHNGIGVKFNIDDKNRSILSRWLFIKKVEEAGIKVFKDKRKLIQKNSLI